MNSMLKLTTYLAIVAVATAIIIGKANATTISYTSLTSGASTVTVSGYTATATGNTAGGVFGSKTVNGVTGVGISGGSSVVDGEIDNNETLSFVSAPDPSIQHLLNGFTVSFLYASGNFGDTVNEVAVLDATGNVLTELILSVVNATNATLTGVSGATVMNLSAADNSGGGEWAVSGLSVAFSSLVFKAGDGGATSNLGDFAFVNFTASDLSTTTTTTVPEPGGLVLVATALLAFAFARRRAPRGVRQGRVVR